MSHPPAAWVFSNLCFQAPAFSRIVRCQWMGPERKEEIPTSPFLLPPAPPRPPIGQTCWGAYDKELGEIPPPGQLAGHPGAPPQALTPLVSLQPGAGHPDPPSNRQSSVQPVLSDPFCALVIVQGLVRRAAPPHAPPSWGPHLSCRDPGVSPPLRAPRTGSRGCGLTPGLCPRLQAQVSDVSVAAEPPDNTRSLGAQLSRLQPRAGATHPSREENTDHPSREENADRLHLWTRPLPPTLELLGMTGPKTKTQSPTPGLRIPKTLSVTHPPA